MQRTLIIVLLASLSTTVSFSQPMTLVTGEMTIHEGTTLRLEGPLSWTLGAGTTVTNDGRIELGSEAMLLEPDGSPVVGAGTERALIDQAQPFSGLEAGGLGLALSYGGVASQIEVVRGHQPFSFPEGDPSIGRWFMITSDEAPGETMDVLLRYDGTELGGLQASALSLYRSSTEAGPWTALASIVDGNTLSGTIQYPWDLLSAFDANAPTTSPTLVARAGFHVWPTLASEELNIVALEDGLLQRFAVFDALGRAVVPEQTGPFGPALVVDIGALAAGSYYLRLNGETTIKFRKA